ncbi:Ig-like domain (group 2), partial [Lachnospiraceae bacterium C10]
MANFKKGVALVLAAATAFTFAPVANLAPVTASAAATQIADATDLNLVLGETKSIKIKDISAYSIQNYTVSSSNKNVAYVTTTTTTGAAVSADGATTGASLTFNYSQVGKTFDIYAAGNGTAVITLTANNTNGAVVTETFNVSVNDKIEHISVKKTSDNSELSTAKPLTIASTDIKATPAASIKTNVTATVANRAGTTLKAVSDDPTIVTVANGTGNTFDITPVKIGSTTVTVTDTDAQDKILASYTFAVTVARADETLKVTYDSNRDGKNEDYKADSTNGHSKQGNAVYLDDDKTSFQIVAESALGRKITYTSSNPNAVSVDNNGLVVVSDKVKQETTVQHISADISVKTEATKIGTTTVPAAEVVVPVHFVNKKYTTLSVADAEGNVIAQTVNSPVDLADTNKDSKIDASDDAVITLSTKDKTSVNLVVASNAGDNFVSGEVFAPATNGKIGTTKSDVVTYANGVLTVAKTDITTDTRAFLVLEAKPSTATYGANAKITLQILVTTKNANNVIDVAKTLDLNASTKTATIAAKATYGNILKYELVEADATQADGYKAVAGNSNTDLSVNASTGLVTYKSKNSGSQVVRITGTSNATAVAPKAAYVTVNYSVKKNASDLAVAAKSIILEEGKTAAIGATASTAITYVSSDESVATVAADGTVTAVKAGSAEITVKAASDDKFDEGVVTIPVVVSKKAENTVVPKPAKVTGVKVANVKGAKVKVSFKKVSKAAGY